MAYPDIQTFLDLPWEQIQPYFDELHGRDLSPESIRPWLLDWTCLQELLTECSARIRVNYLKDTAHAEAEARYKRFLAGIFPEAQKANQALTQKLLAYVDAFGPPPGLEIPLRTIRAEAALFRAENLPLQTAEHENAMRFNKIAAAQTIVWQGEEQTITQLSSVYEESDRGGRRRIWELVNARQMQDRAAINDLWVEVLGIRMQQAANAGFPGDYRAYRWQRLSRFDYSPQDSKSFQDAIEKAAVPAAGRVYAKYCRQFGVSALSPWDLELYQQTYPVKPGGGQAFQDEAELLGRAQEVFSRVDPEIGEYFGRLVRSGSIDFMNRKGKGPGAFCTSFPASRSPFIFGNTVGKDDDVRTLLHECGHAFHAFESFRLPYFQQRDTPMEFNEVASTAMELLASPYLGRESGGYFSPEAAAGSRVRHLEKLLLFWPYMAVVDAFQHWVYENPELAARPENCDAAWSAQWDRFIPWIDWTGAEDARAAGWHRKRHIHRSPFYYIEYGLAQLGAAQIWSKARRDQAGAVRDYRRALALGGTAPLPELYTAAGGKFAFDPETVGAAVGLIETVLAQA